MILENYVSKLETIKNTLPDEVDKIILKNKNVILVMLKFRLFNFGIDGDYEPLKKYSNKTIAIKKKNNQKTNVTTLRDQGNFYSGMYLEQNKGEILISSKDYKTPLLVEKYGAKIFDLTNKQELDIVNNIIEPELKNLIDSIGNFEIKM